jgi:hypothetical protein
MAWQKNKEKIYYVSVRDVALSLIQGGEVPHILFVLLLATRKILFDLEH